MAYRFDESVLAAVLGHMNDDHRADNVLIARAFGPVDDAVDDAAMTGYDGQGGSWEASLSDGTTVHVRVDWPGGPITERPDVRREIVALYDAACRRLGVQPRPHA